MIKLAWVVERQEVEFVGEREDHVKVRGGQQLLFPCSKPALARGPRTGTLGGGVLSSRLYSPSPTLPAGAAKQEGSL
jgi:hypothetical protein